MCGFECLGSSANHPIDDVNGSSSNRDDRVNSWANLDELPSSQEADLLHLDMQREDNSRLSLVMITVEMRAYATGLTCFKSPLNILPFDNLWKKKESKSMSGCRDYQSKGSETYHYLYNTNTCQLAKSSTSLGEGLFLMNSNCIKNSSINEFLWKYNLVEMFKVRNNARILSKRTCAT